MTYETYKDSRSRSYVPFLPFSLFVLVQQDDGVVAVSYTHLTLPTSNLV